MIQFAKHFKMKIYNGISSFFTKDLKDLICNHWYPLCGLIFVILLIGVLFTKEMSIYISPLVGFLFGGMLTYFIQLRLDKSRLKEDLKFKIYDLIFELLNECELFLAGHEYYFDNLFDIEYLAPDSIEEHDEPVEKLRHAKKLKKIYGNKYFQDYFGIEKLKCAMALHYLCENTFGIDSPACQLALEVKNMIPNHHHELDDAIDCENFSEVKINVKNQIQLLKKLKEIIAKS